MLIPNLAYEDQNISVDIHLVNKYPSSQDVITRVELFAPDGNRIAVGNFTATVPANTLKEVEHKIIVTTSTASNSPHLIRATIMDPAATPPNIKEKWITVSKGQKKVPVPDMPIFLGLFVGIFAMLFIFRKK